MRKQNVLLMVRSKSGESSPVEVGRFVYPIIYRILYIPGGELAGFLNHQQYHLYSSYGTLKFLKMMSIFFSTLDP